MTCASTIAFLMIAKFWRWLRFRTQISRPSCGQAQTWPFSGPRLPTSMAPSPTMANLTRPVGGQVSNPAALDQPVHDSHRPVLDQVCPVHEHHAGAALPSRLDLARAVLNRIPGLGAALARLLIRINQNLVQGAQAAPLRQRPDPDSLQINRLRVLAH